MNDELEKALIADSEKLLALTGFDHGPFCPQCMGDGYFMITVCCNRPTRGGECCGNGEPWQEACETCGGSGKLSSSSEAQPNGSPNPTTPEPPKE